MAWPNHYTDNDPINKVDPLGLRTQDSGFSPGMLTPMRMKPISFRQQQPAGDPCGAMELVGVPRPLCDKLLQLAGVNLGDFKSEVSQEDCGGLAIGCQLIFSRKLTGLLADLAVVLDGLWNINGATAFVSQAGFASNKAFLNDPGLKKLAVETLKVMTEDQWNKGSPVLLIGINHDPNEALMRAMCAMGGPSIEQAVKDFGQESLITDFLSSRGKNNGLNCYDMLDVIGANGFNLYERLRGGFRTGAGREVFECVGVNILASVKFWNPHITEMVWESYPCRS